MAPANNGMELTVKSVTPFALQLIPDVRRMRKFIVSFAAVLAASGMASSQEEETRWPELSDFGFVTGRAATEKDAEAGNAVFVLKVEGEVVGEPLDLEIPQYAMHINVDTGVESKVIVIQAEAFEDTKVIGAIEIGSGGAMAGLLIEFELLGTEVPSDE